MKKGTIALLVVALGSGCTSAWKYTGIPSSEIPRWKKAHFRPEEAVVWFVHGFSPEEASRWRELLPAVEADTALASRVQVLRTWKDAGFEPHEVPDWMRAGYSPERAALWKGSGLRPSEALEWENLGFSPERAGMWHRAGYTPGDAIVWDRMDFLPEEAEAWMQVLRETLPRENPASFPAWAQLLRSQNISPEEARAWMNVFYGGEVTVALERTLKWKRAGFSPREAKFLSPELSPEEARALCPSTLEWEKTGEQQNLSRIFLPGTRDDPSPLLDLVGSCILDVKARWEYTLENQAGLAMLSTVAGRALGYLVELVMLDEMPVVGKLFKPSFEKLIQNPRVVYLELCGPREAFLREIPERKGWWFEGPVKIAGVKEVGVGNRVVYLPHLVPLSCFVE